MFKKILYIVASFLLGFMIILYVINSAFYKVFEKINAEAVAEKDYETAESYFSRAYDQNKFFNEDVVSKDGVKSHIEIYSALNDGIRYHEATNEKDEIITTEYYSLESSIQVSIFHLPQGFDTVYEMDSNGNALRDEEGNLVSKGGVKFVYSDNGSLFFPFINTFNYFDLVKSFSFLAVSISEIEYVEAFEAANISADAVINAVEIYDDAGDMEFTFTLAEGKNPSFNTKFHETFADIVEKYNKMQLDSALGKEVSDQEISNVENEYFAIAEASGYKTQPSTKTIYRSSKFITRIVLAAVIYTAIVVLIGWLIFRKKKTPRYVPPGYKNRMQYQQNKKPAPKREPEQFSRDVFDLNKEDVSEK